MFAINKKVWVLHTQAITNPYDPSFKKLVDFIKTLPGFFAAHPNREGMLWLFDSKENAKSAKEKLIEYGTKPSNNICRGTCVGKSLTLEAIDN